MQLVAKKSFPYGGRRVNPGDPFNASKKDAALLVHVKYADYDMIEKKQDYKKQNMVAEQSTKPSKKASKEPPKKREYKRRDMKADD